MNISKVLLLMAVVGWFCEPVWGQENSLNGLAEKITQLQDSVKVSNSVEESLSYHDRAVKLAEKLAESDYDFFCAVVKDKMIFTYRNGMYEEMEEIASKLITAAKKRGDSIGATKNYKNLGLAQHRQGKFEQAKTSYDSSLLKAMEINDTANIISTLNSIGNLYEKTGRPSEALKTLLKGLSLSALHSEHKMLATLHQNIGVLFFHQQNYEKALYHYQKSLEEHQRTESWARLGGMYNNIGSVYNASGQFSKAEEQYLKAIEINIKYNDKRSLGYSYNDLGVLYKNAGKLADATEYLKKAFNLREANNDLKGQFGTAINLGNLFLKRGLLKKAKFYLEQADSLSKKFNDPNIRVKLFEALSEYYLESGDFLKSRNQLFAAHQLKDTLINKQHIDALQEMETRYQTEQKELKIQALQREKELQAQINRNQRLGLGGLGLGILVLAGLSIFLYRQRQRIQAQKSEIELLHREQRHRMMNNLVFANSLMSLQVNRLKEQPEAQQAVKEADARLRAMSALQSRLHHDGEGQKTVAIREYLEEVTTALQRSFGSPEQPLRIHLHAPDAERVDGEAAMRIGLIVNELATNSCKHAFAEQPNPEINVALQPETSGRYRLIYTDNGSGLPTDFQVDTKQSMGLFLIHNLVKQLNGRIAFSGDQGTRVECELDLKAA